ncbi:MAG: hypothetical protein ACPL5F_04890 [Moorellaceae bacterium]
MDGRGRQLRQDVEFAGKPAEALSQALVWPARVSGASLKPSTTETRLEIRQHKKNLTVMQWPTYTNYKCYPEKVIL